MIEIPECFAGVVIAKNCELKTIDEAASELARFRKHRIMQSSRVVQLHELADFSAPVNL